MFGLNFAGVLRRRRGSQLNCNRKAKSRRRLVSKFTFHTCFRRTRFLEAPLSGTGVNKQFNSRMFFLQRFPWETYPEMESGNALQAWHFLEALSGCVLESPSCRKYPSSIDSWKRVGREAGDTLSR